MRRFYFRDAFLDLLLITADIFEETVVSDLGLKIHVQIKGKGVSRKKKTIGLVYGDVELVEEGGRRKISSLGLFARPSYICNMELYKHYNSYIYSLQPTHQTVGTCSLSATVIIIYEGWYYIC